MERLFHIDWGCVWACSIIMGIHDANSQIRSTGGNQDVDKIIITRDARPMVRPSLLVHHLSLPPERPALFSSLVVSSFYSSSSSSPA